MCYFCQFLHTEINIKVEIWFQKGLTSIKFLRHHFMSVWRTYSLSVWRTYSLSVWRTYYLSVWRTYSLSDLHDVQEVTRRRSFDGAYARGLWAAGSEFHMLPNTAVFMEMSQPKRNCRSGSDIPMVAYASFLQVRNDGKWITSFFV